METTEEVKDISHEIAEQSSRQARWNRSAKIVHVVVAIVLALTSIAMAAFSDVEPVGILVLGVSTLIAAVMAFFFRRDERKMAVALAEAECILAHIESGLPFKVTEYNSQVVKTVREFGKKSDDNGEGL